MFMTYYSDQHNITSLCGTIRVSHPRRYLIRKNNDILKELQNQTIYDDLFITKYPKDETIETVILDFDGKDKEKVWHEVLTIHNFLQYKGVNSVIVSSTNKGYHLYIQTNKVRFNKEALGLERKERNKVFTLFTENLISQKHFRFQSLDETNTHAGLGGNIRLIGSIHPKTCEKVHIEKGEFRTDKENYFKECSHYVDTMYNTSIKEYQVQQELTARRVQEDLRKRRKKYDNHFKDPILENDLRILIPQHYGGTVKKYDGYIFMQCPFHVDRTPSLKVTKEWFYCTACGKKGNIWTLIKEKEIKL